MRKFIKKISAFIIIIGLIFCGFELLIRSMNQDTYYSIKNDYVIDNSSDIELLILGASHTYNGIRPDLLSVPSYNLAIPAQGLKLDYELLNGYIDGMCNLKTLIIDISYFSFRTSNFANKNTEHFYINYNLYMAPKIECNYKYNFAVLNSGYVKHRFNDYLEYRIRKQKPCCDSLGWSAGLIKSRPNNWEETAKGTIKIQTYKKSDAVQNNIEYLSKIIKLCKCKSVRLIAVTTPTWHTYYNSLNKDQYLETQTIMSEICQEYNMEYYNFISDIRFNSNDFYNADHLSDIGAEKFTRILADTLNL